ncbi:MAG TPA: ribose-phosphate pyrophosphokinase [Methylophilaceae bacterium]|nr:ribose-phosphate pyrophosphokinase [Methylophilaceae bacterium]
MKPILFVFPGNQAWADPLAREIKAELGRLTLRHFPDGESYVRIESEVASREIILALSLNNPDEHLLPLLFAAGTLRELGAARIGLVTPYLAYMRQDKRFHAGEAISSVHFARLLSNAVDWLVTVDPHLHRFHSLDEIYSIPSHVAHAAPLIADWICRNVDKPVLIGPDSESAQWTAAVAQACGAPSVILQKVRHGDRDVEIAVPQVEQWCTHTPVLVDDIISTAHTMAETICQLQRAGLGKPVCIGVHAIFAEGAQEALQTAGAARIVTCNTVTHPSNDIDVTALLGQGVRTMLFPQNSPPSS